MTLKVHQLAKEMGISSKELTQKALDMGIQVKNHMSNLSEQDVERLKGGHHSTKIDKNRTEEDDSVISTDTKVNKPKPPMNRPIIDTAFLEARSRGEVKQDSKSVGQSSEVGELPKDSKEKIDPQTSTVAQREEKESSDSSKQNLSGNNYELGDSIPSVDMAKSTDQRKSKEKAKVHDEVEVGRTDELSKAEKTVVSDTSVKAVSKSEYSGEPISSGKTDTSKVELSTDVPDKTKRDENVAADDRPAHARRENRPRRDDRPPHMRAEKPLRDENGIRDDRPPHMRKPAKPLRDEHGVRDDRPPHMRKADQKSRGQRDDRGDRPRRDDRPAHMRRDDRSGRDSKDMRDGRRNRDDRSGRDNRFSKDDRYGRDDRGRYGDRRNDRRDSGYGKDTDEMSRPDSRGHRSSKRQDRERTNMDRLETKTNQSRHADKKKNQSKYKDKKDKFNKFDQNMDFLGNLEKKSRKKKSKVKPQIVETEVIEETLPEGTIRINVPITVAGFCEQAEVSQATVIMSLMKLGIMANINQNIDEDTVLLLAEDLGIDVVIGAVEEEAEEIGIEDFEDKEEDLKARPPIITVMGHVDHGKTSLLDAIRKTDVTTTESGGITQHIGASEVSINGHKIVFLDTPGHEAFTAMRARGAHVTDIAVLVVAADDSVKPQTVESISHAKAAGVPIIVAINKMDKPAANPDKVKQDLTEYGILVEDWGGDVISVPVSAKSGEGITNLLEMILLQAEVLELKANPSRFASGSVIEARLDKAKGPVATLLVTNGTLKSGQSIVAGTSAGRIRLMTDYKGKSIKKAGPATAVEVLGLTEVPQAGDVFNAVKEDKVARDIADKRKAKLREEVLARNSSTTLEKLFSQIQEGEAKELNLIIKGDVQGSVGAIVSSLEKLNTSEVKVNIIHTGVGTVNESDVMLAGTSEAVIIGFNVRPSSAVTALADRENIQIRTYRVIYDIIDDVENAMKGMLDPEFKEEILGKVEIRNTFKVPGVGIIGGAYVTEGKVVRNADVRLVRDGIVIHEGRISSLKRFKDDVKEVAQGYECGIGIEDYNDIKEGDLIECFHMVEIERK